MKKQFFILASLCLALTACDKHHSGPKSMQDNTQNRSNTNPTDYNADNTGRNVRDRNPTLTAGNQSENEMDRTITQRIRQALMDDDSLSTNAKNIKIITVNGIVTLRGPVNNDREKSVIGQRARTITGVRNVDNQIEIIRITTENGSRADMNDAQRGEFSRTNSDSFNR